MVAVKSFSDRDPNFISVNFMASDDSLSFLNLSRAVVESLISVRVSLGIF